MNNWCALCPRRAAIARIFRGRMKSRCESASGRFGWGFPILAGVTRFTTPAPATVARSRNGGMEIPKKSSKGRYAPRQRAGGSKIGLAWSMPVREAEAAFAFLRWRAKERSRMSADDIRASSQAFRSNLLAKPVASGQGGDRKSPNPCQPEVGWGASAFSAVPGLLPALPLCRAPRGFRAVAASRASTRALH